MLANEKWNPGRVGKGEYHSQSNIDGDVLRNPRIDHNLD